ncbi:hypothetical protein BGZ65_003556 [Modicella reniformis]|uniref:RNase III domain-containing protein n=1 Tax=Modicella reniformis TaxID=1440133 RepID=A0A9P6MBB1_9FUNG|nr:hypothetical protein BGZ65_003556 [Modicella reniformis]
MRIVTHPSYDRVGIQTNNGLDVLGGKALKMYVLEYLHVKYPKLPADTLQEAVEVYTRTNTLNLMGREFGVDDVLRWTRPKPESGYQLAITTIRASVVRAVIGALYVDQGPIKARDFVHAHFLSRQFDLASLLKIEEPKRYLSYLMKRLGQKLGEGFGHSIDMAESRANKDALTKYYMEELKDFTLPSDVEKEGFVYVSTKIGDTQIIV